MGPSPRSGCGPNRVRSSFGVGWAAGKNIQVFVADVAEVIDADFAVKETVGSEFAQQGEEFDAGAEAGVLLRVFAIGDQVEDFFLLVRGALEIELAVAIGAGIVEPHEASAERELVVFVFAGNEVDELGSAR